MSLERGIELFNQGRYWDAHEAWEEAWMPDRHGPDRGFYKGLIQVAAGNLHYLRRNRRGAHNKWTTGAAHLRPYLPSHHDLDLEPLVHHVDELLLTLDGSPAWPEGLTLPHIQRRRSRP
jgi:predicted metal-dependent hydrolase